MRISMHSLVPPVNGCLSLTAAFLAALDREGVDRFVVWGCS